MSRKQQNRYELPPQPAHEPTAESRERVETMSGLGVPQGQIAKLEGISEPTLRKYYRDELDLGAARANTKVAQHLFRIATTDDSKSAVTACIFWLKTRARWAEPRDNNHDGKLEIQVNYGPRTRKAD